MADTRDTHDTSATRDAQDDTPRVVALNALSDFKVADGFPDPRGWDVIASDGMKAGEVCDLIVDTDAMRTRYLDVKLDTDLTGEERDRDVLIPVGAARLDDADDHVMLDAMTTAQLAALPVYTQGAVTREYEDALLARMPASATASARSPVDDDYYSSPHFDDSRYFGARGNTTPTISRRSSIENLGADVRDNVDSGETGRAVGEGIGFIGGAAAGAAIGSIVGPIGTAIGSIAGAVGGWWAGRGVAETAEGYAGTTDTHYRNRFESAPVDMRGRFTSYDQARPLYQLGYLAAQNPDYAGRSFDQIEPDLQRGWGPEMEQQYGSWNDVRGTVADAYDAERAAT